VARPVIADRIAGAEPLATIAISRDVEPNRALERLSNIRTAVRRDDL
jgi:hypothetical protein